MRLIDNTIVGLNNLVVRGRRVKAQADEVLLLFSSCLQNSQCEQRITTDLGRCKRCGKCSVAALLDLADELGVQTCIATGGHLALERAMDSSVKAIVAVACQKELREGLLGCFPKPVVAVAIDRPNGPCRDTCIDVDAVRRAIEQILMK